VRERIKICAAHFPGSREPRRRTRRKEGKHALGGRMRQCCFGGCTQPPKSEHGFCRISFPRCLPSLAPASRASRIERRNCQRLFALLARATNERRTFPFLSRYGRKRVGFQMPRALGYSPTICSFKNFCSSLRSGELYVSLAVGTPRATLNVARLGCVPGARLALCPRPGFGVVLFSAHGFG